MVADRDLQRRAARAMSRRDNLERCAACAMHETLCICALVPRLATRTRLALIVHYREERKPTNTGQLAARCLERSSIAIVGDRARPLEPVQASAAEQPVLLFPAGDAVPVTDFAASARPVVLIVPDGNWRQASKFRKRIPGLDAMPCAVLPDAGPSDYRLRAEPHAGGLATFEAIARALRILEGEAGPAIEAAMLAVFRVMVERTLWLRGALADADVTGGVPAAALARNPRGTPARRA
jgi:DTW domain-containing protein